MPQDQETTSRPPNDPMDFGGEERKAGYGKYAPDTARDSQAENGVPGAHGNPQPTTNPDRDLPDADEVNVDKNIVHPSEDAPGVRAAMRGGRGERDEKSR
jgi:hypothetical protein